MMHAMILAAGKGERMRPLTNTTPKPLLKVNGRSLIEYHLLALAQTGIKDVVINLHHLGEQIISALGDGSSFGIKIHYTAEEYLLNTGGGIVNALAYLGKEPFLVLSADIFCKFDLRTLHINPDHLAHIVLVSNPDYNSQGDFSLENGLVMPKADKTFTYANIGIFRPEFFANAPSGAFGLGDLLRKHSAKGLISGEVYNGCWYNVGTPADLQIVNALNF